MTDDLDHIRRKLAAAPPPAPSGAARRAARDAALAAFETATERDSAEDTQGSADRARPRIRQSGLMTLFGRVSEMIQRSAMRMTMLGGASLAALTLAVLASHQLRDHPATIGESFAPETAIRHDEAQPSADLAENAPAVSEREADRLRAPAAPALSRAEQMPAETRALSDIAQSSAMPGARKIAPGVAGLQPDTPAPFYREQGRDRFDEIRANGIKLTSEEPVSTFSVDVDTSAYSFIRAQLMNGVLPQKDAVRIEEMVNYFPYDYPAPDSRETPFRADVTIMPTPWNAETRLMRIGIQGYRLAPAEKPRSNLVFLVDTSGSMQAPDKLPLLINSLRLLVDGLEPEDTVSIVAYAGAAGTVLEPTRIHDKAKILAALDQLSAGGSTAGAEGIRQAYRLAEANFDADGINRVILATDGDFNVGITDPRELEGFVERKRESGIFLSVLGFGEGNYNDALIQALAQNGNGNAAYIDTLSEARKTLVEEASSTLFPIAKDVKIQVEFNPATVAAYRLIGYENRLLAREDFNNDRVDAGEIGAGHQVTALYEITPVGAELPVDALRYQTPAAPAAGSEEYAFLKIRYKAPEGETSKLVTRPITPDDRTDAPDADARFAAAVAAFGEILRGGEHIGDFGHDEVIELANGARGADPFGYRAEFVNLVRLAKSAAALEPGQQ